MVTIDDFTAVFFVFQAVFLITTALFVIYSGVKKKMNNVVILGISFLFTSLAIIGVILGISFDDMQNVYNLGLVGIAIFVRTTFFRKRHSGYRIILTSVILLYILKVFSYNVYHEEGIWFYVDTLAQTLLVAIPLIYYAQASLRAYNDIKNKQLLPHVIRRLQIMGYVSYFAILGNLPIWVLEIITGTPYDELPYGSALVIFLVTITSFAFSVGMYLSWVMPNWFKNYLNRDYDGFVIEEDETKEDEDFLKEFTESEQKEIIDGSGKVTSTIEMIAFLGDQLHQIAGTKILVSKGLIRFSIRDFFNNIPLHVQFNQWIDIINIHLKKRLERLVKDPELVCSALTSSLIDNQSVITMISV